MQMPSMLPLTNSEILERNGHNFTHLQAAHCENGVATGLLKLRGLDFANEPLIFGIGYGLFYIHIPFLSISNGPAISFRSMPGQIFKNAAKSLGVEVIRKKFKNEASAKAFLDGKIEAGEIVGCQVGVYHLPYFPPEYRFHFNAHNIIVFGKENGHYLVSDPVMEEITRLSEEDMMRVRFSKGPLAPRGQVYYPGKVEEVTEKHLRKAIGNGIKWNIRFMIKAPGGIVGVNGIRYTARQVRKWRSKLGPKRAGLYLGQIVRMQEEIGTGGGGFRFIYAAFLQQASEILKNDDLGKISEDFTKAGDMWRASAMEMAQVYRGRNTDQSKFDEISEMMMEIANTEKLAFKKLDKIRIG